MLISLCVVRHCDMCVHVGGGGGGGLYMKVTEVRGNFVEDECYQMATELQETSLRPDIGVACA